MLSHDARLRCDMVDLYYSLYGTKRPPGMLSAELSSMFRPPKVSATQAATSAATAANAPVKLKSESKTRPSSPIEEKPLHIIDDAHIKVDDAASRESGVHVLQSDASDSKPSLTQTFANTIRSGAAVAPKSESTAVVGGGDSDASNSRINEEIIDVDELDAVKEERPPPAKKMKTDYGSDNSASLPGLSGAATGGPVGFEPGMFKQDADVGEGAAAPASTAAATATADASGGKVKGDKVINRREYLN